MPTRASNALENKSANKLFGVKSEPVFVGIISIQECQIMDGCDVCTTVKDRLLWHTKMHQVGFEGVEELLEAQLLSE